MKNKEADTKKNLLKVVVISAAIVSVVIMLCLAVVIKARFDVKHHLDNVYNSRYKRQLQKIRFYLQKDAHLPGRCGDVVIIPLNYRLCFRYRMTDDGDQDFFVNLYWPLQTSKTIVVERSRE